MRATATPNRYITGQRALFSTGTSQGAHEFNYAHVHNVCSLSLALPDRAGIQPLNKKKCFEFESDRIRNLCPKYEMNCSGSDRKDK